MVKGGISSCARRALAADFGESAFVAGAGCYIGGVSRGETQLHARLKTLALAWAQANGLPICAPEVRVPRSGFRADVAATGLGSGARCAIFECKQARADLRKDGHAEAATAARLAELLERRRKLEELLAGHRPDLRRGEALWPEYDAWDFSALEHRTYHQVLDEIETLQRRGRHGTKFSRMYRYRCADFLYLVTEPDIFAEAEIPAGWGLLVHTVRADGAGDGLRLDRPPVGLDPTTAQRTALLEAIALAGTRAVNRAAGLAGPPHPVASHPK